jgi:hypothetical protein
MEALAEEAWQSGAQAEAEALEVAGQARVGERIALYMRDCASWRLATIGSYSEAKKSHRVDIHAAGVAGAGAAKRKWLRLHEERWVPHSALAVDEEQPPEAPAPPEPPRPAAHRPDAQSRPAARRAAVVAAERARETDRHEGEGAEEKDDDQDKDGSSGGEESQASSEAGEAGGESSDAEESGPRIQKKKPAAPRRKRARSTGDGPIAVSRPAKPPPKPMIEMTVRELIHERKQGIPTSAALARSGRRRAGTAGEGEGANGRPAGVTDGDDGGGVAGAGSVSGGSGAARGGAAGGGVAGSGAVGSGSSAGPSGGNGSAGCGSSGASSARAGASARASSDHFSLWEKEQMRLDDLAEMENGPMLEGDAPGERAAFAPQLRFDSAGQIILDVDTLQVSVCV